MCRFLFHGPLLIRPESISICFVWWCLYRLHVQRDRHKIGGMLLENEGFLSELTRMFKDTRLKGSVTMTMKRYDGRTKPTPRKGRKPLPEPTEYMCLIRATRRNKKIATVVHPKDVNKFQQAYCNLLKGNLDGLKKLKKTKTKAKATQ